MSEGELRPPRPGKNDLMNATSLIRIALVIVALALGLPWSTAMGQQATSLIELYEIALERDPEYQAATATNLAAQELKPQARSFLLPNLSAGGFARHNWLDVDKSNSISSIGSRDFNSQQADISLTQPIYRQDLWVALEQADLRTRQANADFAFARQELMLRVATRYFDVLRALDQLTFAKAALEAFGQQLKQAQQRFEVGLIAITDVEEAQSGFDLATADVIAAENDLDNAREALREVAGTYIDVLRPLVGDIPLVTPEPDNIDLWTETALRQNLQVSAARFAAANAREEIARIKAGHLPTLDLVGRHVYFNSDGGLSGASRTNDTAIGLELTVPIYEGGLVTSQTRESQHLYQRSLDDLERQRRAVQRQTRDAFLGIKSGISRVKALAQAVKSTISAKEAIDAGFQVGTRTSVDVLDAERRVFEARRDLSFARYDYILDRLQLKQAAGTLSEADVELVNSWLQP